MSKEKVTVNTGMALGNVLFVIFLIMKLTEKCAFWGDNFPRFLKSTTAWWDGWFMVLLPLWVGIPIALIVILIAVIIGIVANK